MTIVFFCSLDLISDSAIASRTCRLPRKVSETTNANPTNPANTSKLAQPNGGTAPKLAEKPDINAATSTTANNNNVMTSCDLFITWLCFYVASLNCAIHRRDAENAEEAQRDKR